LYVGRRSDVDDPELYRVTMPGFADRQFAFSPRVGEVHSVDTKAHSAGAISYIGFVGSVL